MSTIIRYRRREPEEVMILWLDHDIHVTAGNGLLIRDGSVRAITRQQADRMYEPIGKETVIVDKGSRIGQLGQHAFLVLEALAQCDPRMGATGGEITQHMPARLHKLNVYSYTVTLVKNGYAERVGNTAPMRYRVTEKGRQLVLAHTTNPALREALTA